MSQNRQSGFDMASNSSRLQWGTVPHQDPTKSSAISKRNCRVPNAASGQASHQGCRPWPAMTRLGALLGVRGTGRSGNGSGKWQHRDGSCSSCVPTHGRNRLAAAMLHQRLDRAHYQWAQAESSTGQPRSLQACSARPFARIPGPFTRCLLC